jgi:hypothetical protein
MRVPPVEPQSWGEDENPEPNAEDVARALREQLAVAKRRMRAYREEMEASGLAKAPASDASDPAD